MKKTSRARQTVTGLVIASAITMTLVCGVVMALAESQSAVSMQPTPTVYHIATLPPSAQPAGPGPTSAHPTVVVIPTRAPATASATRASTGTATATLKSTSEPTQYACHPQSNWATYRVQPGDTLFLIGLRYGLSVTSIMRANCLEQTLIRSGDVVYVPHVTPRPLPDGFDPNDPPTDPPPTGTQTATDGACTNPDSVMNLPKVGAVLSGKTTITGTARVPNFSFYKLEIRQEGTGQPFSNLYTGDHEVVNGPLADLDTAIFPNGEFWLRLVVVDSDGNYPERCSILVTLLH